MHFAAVPGSCEGFCTRLRNRTLRSFVVNKTFLWLDSSDSYMASALAILCNAWADSRPTEELFVIFLLDCDHLLDLYLSLNACIPADNAPRRFIETAGVTDLHIGGRCCGLL